MCRPCASGAPLLYRSECSPNWAMRRSPWTALCLAHDQLKPPSCGQPFAAGAGRAARLARAAGAGGASCGRPQAGAQHGALHCGCQVRHWSVVGRWWSLSAEAGGCCSRDSPNGECLLACTANWGPSRGASRKDAAAALLSCIMDDWRRARCLCLAHSNTQQPVLFAQPLIHIAAERTAPHLRRSAG